MLLSEQTNLAALIKLILMGVSGTGKSTGLVPLAIPEIIPGFPGLKLRIMDFDGKAQEVFLENLIARLDPNIARLKQLTPISKEQYEAARANVDIERLRERTTIRNGQITILGAPKSWEKALRVLEKWERSWDAQTVLVPDSLTYAATISIVAATQALNNKTLASPMTWQEYQEPQRLVRNFLTYLADIPAHVILCTHQENLDVTKKTGEFLTKADGTKEPIEEVVDSMMVPISIGSKGRATIPAQFNHMLVAAETAEGERRIYLTMEDGVVPKTPFFARAKASYPLDTGLVEFFMLGLPNKEPQPSQSPNPKPRGNNIPKK